MTDIPSTPSAFDEWLRRLLPSPAHVLAQMEETAARHQVDMPGPHIGRLLYQLAQVVGARRVFDYGANWGYCAMWVAFAMGIQGRVTCLPVDEGARRRIRENVGRARFEERVDVSADDPRRALAGNGTLWDMALIQLYGASDLHLVEAAPDHVRDGGYLVVFDVLPLLGAPGYTSTEAFVPAVANELKRLLFGRRDLVTTIVPLGKGLGLCLKVAA